MPAPRDRPDTFRRFRPPPGRWWRSWLRTLRFAAAWLGWRLRWHHRPDDDGRAAATALRRLGGTAALIARHLAYRVDLLPPEVCSHLVEVDDDVSVPFPLAEALRRVEATVGRPLPEVFSVIDPTPIRVDCLSMTLQATLRSGERVAVRVLRPDAGRDLVDDLIATSRLCRLAEALTTVPAGYFDELIEALRDLAFLELDLVSVARYQTELRRRARKARVHRQLTAARVHAELSGPDVMVSEFVSGVFASEVIATVETGDPAARRTLAELGVRPEQLGRRLLHAAWWMMFENPFVPIDVQAEGLVVAEGRRLVFVQLGHCENLPSHAIRCWHEALHHMAVGDFSTAATSLTDMIEPFPYIDVELFGHAIEERLAHQLYAMRDRHASVSERASTGMWLALSEVAAERGVVLPPDVIRLMQASLSLEVIALRLHPRLRVLHEVQRYERRARRRELRRAARKLSKTTPQKLAAAAQVELWRTVRDARRLRDQLDATLRYLPISTRISENLPSVVAGLAITLLIRWSLMTILLSVATWLWTRFGGEPPAPGTWLALDVSLTLLFATTPFRLAWGRLAERRERR